MHAHNTPPSQLKFPLESRGGKLFRLIVVPLLSISFSPTVARYVLSCLLTVPGVLSRRQSFLPRKLSFRATRIRVFSPPILFSQNTAAAKRTARGLPRPAASRYYLNLLLDDVV